MTDISLKFIGFKKKSKHVSKIENRLLDIQQLYNTGSSICKISQELGIDETALYKLFKFNNIEIRKQNIYSRKRTLVNEHYFDQINTEEKAYILGLLYADGNNYKRSNRIAIKLLKSDEGLLEKISHIIYGERILSDVVVKKKNKTYYYTTFNIFSKHISTQMEKLGLVPRKSLVLTFPKWLDENLYRHFIRGMVDGDGCIYLNENKKSKVYVSLTGTADVNDFIAQHLLDKFGMTTYKRPVRNQSRKVFYTLVVEGKTKSKVFLDWLYGENTLSLDRKYNKYLIVKNE